MVLSTNVTIVIAILTSLITVADLQGLKMIPESVKVVYANEKYVDRVVANVRRYTRHGDYFMNFQGRIKHTWANNITINVVMTEYLHNEYRRSFIEFHLKFCDMLNKEPMFGRMIAQMGVVCPLPKGEYRLMNMTVQSPNFPNRWPFEKGGADVNITTNAGDLVGSGYIHVLFKQ